MKHVVVFLGCLEHAKRGRICIFLLWPWAFSHCNCSIYCSELLCFWFVSSLVIFLSFKNIGYEQDIDIELLWPSMDNRLKKSLPEKYQKRTETSLLTAVISSSLATLTCYPLDTVRRQMQLKGTPYKTVLDAISG